MSFRQSPLKRQDRKSDPKTTESESQVDDSFSQFNDDRSEYIHSCTVLSELTLTILLFS